MNLIENPIASAIDIEAIKCRDPKFREADMSCLQAILQATVNVELFTIPLYMTSLYSIQGLHQINSKGSNLYQGRWWPGMGPTAGYAAGQPDTYKTKHQLTTNERVFNNVYSVFIEEMLHLQLASNMASKLNVIPKFDNDALQTPAHGWKCYDKDNTTIPHILDFKDCNTSLDGVNPILKAYFKKHYPGKTLQDIKVKLDAMTPVQSLLFLAIEETEEDAHEVIQEKYWNPAKLDPSLNGRPKYFENAPYDWWEASNEEKDLPLFGSIGHMYLCLWNYLEVEYTNGDSLISLLLNNDDLQRDYFNEGTAQYPGIDGSLKDTTDINALKLQLMNNINAITDQGEGGGVATKIQTLWKNQAWVEMLTAKKNAAANSVEDKYQPSVEGLLKKYPGYNDLGELDGISGSACARLDNKSKDHFETFAECLDLMTANSNSNDPKLKYVTWNEWHAENPTNPWTKEMLNPNNTPANYPSLPSAESVATALNNLGATDADKIKNHDIFSVSAVGTLKGLTTSLNDYWENPKTQFPGPAMGGSGDRVSICWSATGLVPDLVTGIENPDASKLYNACQSMSYMNPTEPEDTMPDTVTYHSCKGSNSCRAQGGCGFVQSDKGGGNCSTPKVAANAGCGLPDIKSAPADNKCKSFGGCAVPISASQLYPDQDETNPMMKLYKFEHDAGHYHSKDIDTNLTYEKGESVYDTAWKSYCIATDKLENLDIETEKVGDLKIVTATIKHKPKDTDIRLALPPST